MKKMFSYIRQDRRYWQWAFYFVAMLFLYGVVNQINGTWRSVYYMLKMPFDSVLPFIPGMVFIYVSWYFQLVVVAAYLFYLDYHKVHRQRQHTVRVQYAEEAETFTLLRFEDAAFLRLMRVACTSILVSILLFLLLPTWVDRPDLEDGGAAVAVLQKIYDVDYPTNAFPSLHVALSLVFSYFFCDHVPNKKYPWAIPVMAVWTFFIVLSTVLIQQHYWPDVFGGIVLSLFLLYLEKVYCRCSSR